MLVLGGASVQDDPSASVDGDAVVGQGKIFALDEQIEGELRGFVGQRER